MGETYDIETCASTVAARDARGTERRSVVGVRACVGDFLDGVLDLVHHGWLLGVRSGHFEGFEGCLVAYWML